MNRHQRDEMQVLRVAKQESEKAIIKAPQADLEAKKEFEERIRDLEDMIQELQEKNHGLD